MSLVVEVGRRARVSHGVAMTTAGNHSIDRGGTPRAAAGLPHYPINTRRPILPAFNNAVDEVEGQKLI